MTKFQKVSVQKKPLQNVDTPEPPARAIPKADVPGRLVALQAANTSDLKLQWRQLFGAEPPPFSRLYLQSRLAYRIQELAYGGIQPATVQRLEAMGEQLDGGNLTLRRVRRDDRPVAGTRLVREHQGCRAHCSCHCQRL